LIMGQVHGTHGACAQNAIWGEKSGRHSENILFLKNENVKRQKGAKNTKAQDFRQGLRWRLGVGLNFLSLYKASRVPNEGRGNIILSI
jgi:hypothetical protein